MPQSLLFPASCSLLLVLSATAPAVRNVLHIVADDLRPELGCYGLPNRHTPNLDGLASSPGGTVFDRAYAQQAVCGPSRNSFMSGRRPDASRSWNFINSFREDHPEWTSLPGLFLKAGGLALGSGKLFHPKLPPAYDGNKSWSAEALPYHNPCWNTADNPEAKFQDGGLPCVFCPVDIRGKLQKSFNVSIANEFCSIDAYEDTFSVAEAVRLLRKAKSQQASAGPGGAKPFYLGVGMHKPHLPWQYAAEDLAKHQPLSAIDVPTHPLPPVGAPGIALRMTDANTPGGRSSPWDPVSNDTARKARQAYRASVTGMDRKLGVLLKELDTLGLANSTAVIFHSDHGYQLGEHGEWRKFTNFELGTRVPLIMRVPWLAATAPQRSAALVELVDVLPTAADLAGITLPTGETFDGTSLVPLLGQRKMALDDDHGGDDDDDDDDGGGGDDKANDGLDGDSNFDAAFSQYPRRVRDMTKAWSGNSIIHHERNTFTHMGYSVRTASWRYTEWVVWNQTTLRPIWTDVTARELYDHRNENGSFPTDFNAGENENIASDPAHAEQVATLSKLLHAQFSP